MFHCQVSDETWTDPNEAANQRTFLKISLIYIYKQYLLDYPGKSFSNIFACETESLSKSLLNLGCILWDME